MSAGEMVMGMVVSTIGFVLLRYAIKERRAPQLIGGAVLTAAPLLGPPVLVSLLLAAAVLGGIWWASRNGW